MNYKKEVDKPQPLWYNKDTNKKGDKKMKNLYTVGYDHHDEGYAEYYRSFEMAKKAFDGLKESAICCNYDNLYLKDNEKVLEEITFEELLEKEIEEE
jgi:hypothetical protein